MGYICPGDVFATDPIAHCIFHFPFFSPFFLSLSLSLFFECIICISGIFNLYNHAPSVSSGGRAIRIYQEKNLLFGREGSKTLIYFGM